MAEYIERGEFIKSVKDIPMWGSVAAMLADSIPAADVAPIAHGQWEPGNPICPVCGEDKFKDLDADIWCDWLPDFCPNCGAKMDEGKK